MPNTHTESRQNAHSSVALLLAVAVFLCMIPYPSSAETRVVVRFDPGAVSFPRLDHGFGSGFVARPDDALFGFMDLELGLEAHGVLEFQTIAPFFRHLTVPQYDRFGNVIQLVDTKDDYVVTFSGNQDPDDLIARLRTVPGVSYAEQLSRLDFLFDPGDAYYSDQWYLDNRGGDYDILDHPGDSCPPPADCVYDTDVDASEGWDIVRVPGTKIGLIDTGIRQTHQDLSSSYDPLLSQTGDDCGHGTALSGVVAAAGSNGVGIAGTARPNYIQTEHNLVVLKSVATPGSCVPNLPMATAALALLANDPAYFPRVLVVNESFGGPNWKWEYDTVQRDVHRNAYLKGLTIVAAAGNVTGCWGNSQDSCVVYPAGYNSFVLAATGLDCRGNNLFPHVSWTDLCAPSDQIVTTDFSSNDAYQGKGAVYAHCGTSFSAPIAASVAGLLLGVNSALGPDDLTAVLKKTAVDLGAAGRDDTYGYGLLNMRAAVDYIRSPHSVRFASGSTFSSTLVASRSQEFRRVPGVNGDNEDWRTCWVRVYQVDVWAPFYLGPGETVVDAWARQRLSTGFPDQNKIDRRLLTGYLVLVPGSMSNGGCTLRTYTYKVFTSPTEEVCLTWYPFAVPGQGICGGSALIPRFDYTYVVTGSGMAPERPEGSLDLSEKYMTGGVVKMVRGAREKGLGVEVCDVTGRVVWSGEATAKGEGCLVGPLQGEQGENRVPSGLYFVTLRSGGRIIEAKKLVIVR